MWRQSAGQDGISTSVYAVRLCMVAWLSVFRVYMLVCSKAKFQNELVMVAPAVAFWRLFSSLKLSLKSLSCSELQKGSYVRSYWCNFACIPCHGKLGDGWPFFSGLFLSYQLIYATWISCTFVPLFDRCSIHILLNSFARVRKKKMGAYN